MELWELWISEILALSNSSLSPFSRTSSLKISFFLCSIDQWFRLYPVRAWTKLKLNFSLLIQSSIYVPDVSGTELGWVVYEARSWLVPLYDLRTRFLGASSYVFSGGICSSDYLVESVIGCLMRFRIFSSPYLQSVASGINSEERRGIIDLRIHEGDGWVWSTPFRGWRNFQSVGRDPKYPESLIGGFPNFFVKCIVIERA